MSVKIELTPSELLAQSAEMTSLMQSYESLFNSVTNELNSINANWSKNLAHNFAGKITSAQKTFGEMIEYLSKGSEIARTSAGTYESVDKQLATLFGGQGSQGGGGGGSRGATNVMSSEFYKVLEDYMNSEEGKDKTGIDLISGLIDKYEDYFARTEIGRYISGNAHTATETLDQLEGFINTNIPGFIKDKVLDFIPGDIKKAYSIWRDTLKKGVSSKTMFSFVDYFTGDKLLVSEIRETINVVKSYGGRINDFNKTVEERLLSGDIIGTLGTMVEGFTDLVIGGAVEAAHKVVGGIVDSSMGKLPIDINGALQKYTGYTVGEYIGNGGEAISWAIDKTTDAIHDGVNNIVSGIVGWFE